jgi:hypothetical protein
MKAWVAGVILSTLACVAMLLCSPVLTGTWIVENKDVSMKRALVLTVGISASGPMVRIQKLSALREDELYKEIHDAARTARYNGASMQDPLKDNRHWGGGQAWCNAKDCQRLYIFVGSSLKHVRDTGASAICQLPAPSALENPRRI